LACMLLLGACTQQDATGTGRLGSGATTTPGNDDTTTPASQQTPLDDGEGVDDGNLFDMENETNQGGMGSETGTSAGGTMGTTTTGTAATAIGTQGGSTNDTATGAETVGTSSTVATSSGSSLNRTSAANATNDGDGSVVRVVSVTPANLERDVSLDLQQIVVTFDGPVDPSTIDAESFRVKETYTTNTNGTIAGTIDVDPSGTMVTFTPSIRLTSDTLYSVIVSGNVQDADGDSVTMWRSSFRTAETGTLGTSTTNETSTTATGTTGTAGSTTTGSGTSTGTSSTTSGSSGSTY